MQFGYSRALFFGFFFELLVFPNIATCGVAINRREDGGNKAQDVTVTRMTSTVVPSSSPTSSIRQSTPTITDSAVASDGIATVTTTSLGYPTSSNMASNNGTGPESRLITYSGGLPIEPIITPGLAAAGVLLLLIGLPYCLIGIKRKRLQIFVSTAYLCSLGVTVLIIYVMNPPVSRGVEGGYVVAATVTGLFFGGVAVVFPEVTETLGCILGGFCLSMWFLVLKPGGLVNTVFGKLILIGVLCLVVFGLSFHRLTKPYALIASLSFSGATSIVLGIDCFSRAGLKEFWLYIWDLNDNIFPVNTYTYPHTRGMRVEIAIIILFTAIGIMSQVKLWKILKERRGIRKAQQRQKLADIEALDEDVGRKIAEQDKEEREIWEKTFGNKVDEADVKEVETGGDKDTNKDQRGKSLDSGTGSKTDSGLGYSIGERHIEIIETDDMKKERENYIQMADIPTPASPAKVTSEEQTNTSDEHDPENPEQGEEFQQFSQGEQRLSVQPSDAEEDRPSDPQPLVLNHVHIPHIPDFEEDIMSLATFADTIEGCDFDDERYKRFSVFSMRSMTNKNEMGNIQEEEEEKSSSVNVACDPMEHNNSQESTGDNKELTPEKEVEKREDSGKIATEEEQAASAKPKENTSSSEGPACIGITVSVPDRISAATCTSDAGRRSSSGFSGLGTSKRESDAGLLPEQQSATSKAAGSSALSLSELASQVPAFSAKIFKTYRTNEWAKHLADAEEPQFEDLSVVEQPDVVKEEVPVPVRYVELQETATRRPTLSRTVSMQETENEVPPSINFAVAHTPPASRPVSKLPPREDEVGSTPSISFGVNAPPVYSPATNVSNAPAAKPVTVSTIPERAVTPAPGFVPVSLAGSQFTPLVQSRSKSPLPAISYAGNTLLSKRESIIRSRPSFNALDAGAAPQIAVTSPQAVYSQPMQYQDASFNHRKLDDNMSLSERRNELKQQASRRSSLNAPSPTPPSPTEIQNRREQALKAWRESIKADPQINQMQHHLLHQRSPTPDNRRTLDVLLERQQALKADKHREDNAAQWNGFVGHRMRQPDMLEAHREAMRRLQANANKAM